MSTDGPVRFGTSADDLPPFVVGPSQMTAPQLGKPREHRFSDSQRTEFTTKKFLDRFVDSSIRFYSTRKLSAKNVRYIGEKLVAHAAEMER
jgi:hypothetical protein